MWPLWWLYSHCLIQDVHKTCSSHNRWPMQRNMNNVRTYMSHGCRRPQTLRLPTTGTWKLIGLKLTWGTYCHGHSSASPGGNSVREAQTTTSCLPLCSTNNLSDAITSVALYHCTGCLLFSWRQLGEGSRDQHTLPTRSSGVALRMLLLDTFALAAPLQTCSCSPIKYSYFPLGMLFLINFNLITTFLDNFSCPCMAVLFRAVYSLTFLSTVCWGHNPWEGHAATLSGSPVWARTDQCHQQLPRIDSLAASMVHKYMFQLF